MEMFVSRQKATFALIVLISACALLFVVSFLQPLDQVFRSRQDGFTVWPLYNPHPPHSEEWYNRYCFGSARLTAIEDIGKSLKIWRVSKSSHCRALVAKFEDIFLVEIRHGQALLPKEFVGKVVKWFGGDSNAESQVKDQTMIHVSNVYTHQQTIITPLRARRPVRKQAQDPLDYVMSVANATQPTCDFCNFKMYSAEDVFGRLESKYAFTASNTFKMDKWHGLIAPKVHNFVNLTMDHVIDLLRLAKRWTDKVHEIDHDAIYPILGWDNTEHAGASQFHPHIHAFVDPSHYYEIMENYRWAAQRYSNDHEGSNYFTDITVLHHALGLAVSTGNATAIVELGHVESFFKEIAEFSRKNEVTSHAAKRPGLEKARSGWLIAIMDELRVFSYSMVMVLPIMSEVQQPADMPAMIRITTRGDVNNIYTDISGFDLYLTHNTVRDPYILINKLRNVIRAHEDV